MEEAQEGALPGWGGAKAGSGFRQRRGTAQQGQAGWSAHILEEVLVVTVAITPQSLWMVLQR